MEIMSQDMRELARILARSGERPRAGVVASPSTSPGDDDSYTEDEG